MKIKSFAVRNAKEILRDPLTFIFGLGFPIVILLLLTAIQANVPVALLRRAAFSADDIFCIVRIKGKIS